MQFGGPVNGGTGSAGVGSEFESFSGRPRGNAVKHFDVVITSLALASPGNPVFSVQGVGVVMAFTRSRRFRAIWCSDLSELSFSHHRGR